jgi:hypothetical protein
MEVISFRNSSYEKTISIIIKKDINDDSFNDEDAVLTFDNESYYNNNALFEMILNKKTNRKSLLKFLKSNNLHRKFSVKVKKNHAIISVT